MQPTRYSIAALVWLAGLVALAFPTDAPARAPRTGPGAGLQTLPPDCITRGRFSLSSEGPWTLALGVRADGPCRGTFFAKRGRGFKHLYLVRAPRLGAIALQEGGRFIYKPRNGFRGADDFMLRICGGRRDSRCANLDYRVTVY